ncbi:MAG: hypothetical protein ACFE0J_08515 [Elainellaceae cyanobacterium]
MTIKQVQAVVMRAVDAIAEELPICSDRPTLRRFISDRVLRLLTRY